MAKTAPALERSLDTGHRLRIEAVAANTVRIQISKDGMFSDSGLNRYGFIRKADKDCGASSAGNGRGTATFRTDSLKIVVDDQPGSIRVLSPAGDELLHHLDSAFSDVGATVRLEADEGEDWVGFGDQARDRLFHRGHVADCHVRNVKSYIPVPFFMSTRNVGILVNTTHRIVFDMCRADPDRVEWRDGRGTVDYYVMVGNSFRDLLDAYTDLTGRPRLPPLWSFGLWYICRTQANDYEAVNDALNFRREEIPCDVLGLEPGWMEKNYDGSLNKAWSNERFPIPSYCQNGPHNFFNAIQRMGFHMELWLCCDYDLSHEEDRRAGIGADDLPGEDDGAFFQNDAEVDLHFSSPRYADQVTRVEEGWFKHLEKFVDQGVDFFKQDGAYQVLDHPDRYWGNGMSDREMHNIYPLFYARQMLQGFEEHTGRRGLTFTPCGWAGFQAWAGTWTGDTGGRLPTLGAMLNTAMVGHSWATNDMEVMEKEGIHFGYLLPWSQINSWNYFRMPWVQGDELCAMHRDYACLRARLIPYLYSWAHVAAETGFPLMAPLVLEFQDDPECRDLLHQFMLGRDLMVTIYNREAYLPEGLWKDFWTGDMIEGGQMVTLDWPANRGGGLLLRPGAIVPFGPVRQYRDEGPMDEIELYIIPDQAEKELVLYEDDGTSLSYRQGQFAVTRVRAVDAGGRVRIVVEPTQGTYDGQVKERTWAFRIALQSIPEHVTINGQPVTTEQTRFDEARGELIIPARPGPVEVEIQACFPG
ncbi:MAG: glycoside hydrolase family 31 protein [Lentisphaerae bacterium]|jgi:alpha-glucosidase|nr:glycoside hydrolase family 31 protein [Lentisphaerota bacterium]MBT4815155.1 glycoside hydrolase family 31 protein [Lentisphaerota bacterium]MBT5604752.1 glycoside hydrolase family 31 protein [Lentisphaerota bacterium]MBT7058074.1 glycoside hydrolase family 31 protein [Lentisphaerota bacterium]MBT7841762.1 glycoside hydrolase family 31 protein [Lentisphaerota bacterium]